MDETTAIQSVLEGNLLGKLDPADARKVIELGLPGMVIDANGKARVRNYPAIETATGVNYNRGWLLIRRAFLLVNQPTELVDLNARVPAARKAQTELVAQLNKELKQPGANEQHLRALIERAEFNMDRHVIGKAVNELRLNTEISWGEISVRLDLPEATCRRAFNLVSDRKDRGLRIGKGGRWAYGAGELYQDNRKKEGAQIPVDFKMRPKPEDLMNFIAKAEGTTNKATETKRRNQIKNLLAKAYDKAVGAEERSAFENKAYELVTKYGFNTKDFAFQAKVA